MFASIAHHALYDQSNTGGLNRDPCTCCHKPVFHMERLRIPVAGQPADLLLHRDCFRCAACARPLSLASFHCSADDGFRMTCHDHKPAERAREPAAANEPLQPRDSEGPGTARSAAPAAPLSAPLSVVTEVERLQHEASGVAPRAKRSPPRANTVRAKAARIVAIVKPRALSLIHI